MTNELANFLGNQIWYNFIIQTNISEYYKIIQYVWIYNQLHITWQENETSYWFILFQTTLRQSYRIDLMNVYEANRFSSQCVFSNTL